MPINDDFKIESIKSLDKSIAPAEKIETHDLEQDKSTQATKERFDAVMDQDTQVQAATKVEPRVETIEKLSPLEEMRKLNTKVEAISRSSPETIKGKANELIAEIDSIHQKYAQFADIDIKPSYQTLLKNRLAHIDDTLKIALSKAGLEHTPPPTQVTNNPIEKFLGYLTHGQNQLEKIGHTIEGFQGQGLNMNPADMLMIQVKMHQVQQELEFFTNLLNKSLESTKTLMNVQV